MKLNAKLFLLIFTIITFVSVTSAFIYHTLTQKLLQNQQSKSLINSANDFIFALQRNAEKIDENFPGFPNTENFDINTSNLDFVLTLNSDWVFANNRVSHISVSTVQNVLKLSAKKIGFLPRCMWIV